MTVGALAAALLALPAAAAAAPARIVYEHLGRLWEIDATGANRAPLTTPGPRESDFNAAWSRDGSRLAFARWFDLPGESGDHAQVHVMAAGGAPVALPSPRGVADGSPDWSPDGSRLAFTRYMQRGSAVMTVAADGRGARTLVRRRLLPYFHAVGSPAWSPDGSRIAYVEYGYDARSRLTASVWTVRPDGRGRRRLIRDADSPAWSPDGRRLAVSSVRDHNGTHQLGSDEDGYDGEIYLYDADGTHPVRLTRRRGHDDAPAWSPDGTRIAFQSDRNYPGAFPELNAEVHTVGVDGRCLTWLTNGAPASTGPEWSRAGGDTAPGACGAAGRPALVEFPPETLARFGARGSHWLGPVFGNLLASEVDILQGHGFVEYGDCAAFQPADCPGSLQISTTPACDDVVAGTYEVELAQARHLRNVRGTLVASYDGEAGVSILAGPMDVSVSGLGNYTEDDAYPKLEPVVLALRPYGAPDASQPLAAPVLPRAFKRALDRTVALHARLRSVRETAGRLHVGVGRVRFRLAFARALRPLGTVATIACPPARPPG
ncbi:MAG: hypothetical protein QOE65_1917 [Solirubrobacteraceae bacterium]|nr:hypothetical protein [Solirubrobacteraceae bacterium]